MSAWKIAVRSSKFTARPHVENKQNAHFDFPAYICLTLSKAYVFWRPLTEFVTTGAHSVLLLSRF
jgi:hypothetical protein